MNESDRSRVIPACSFKKKSLRTKIKEFLIDPFHFLRKIDLIDEAMDIQDVRVKPVQDLLAQEMFHRLYDELSIPECRKVNARINWERIQNFAEETTVGDVILPDEETGEVET